MSVVPRYSLALTATGLAAAARLALAPWLGEQLPFIFCFPAVAVVVWFAGAGPAAVTATSSLLVVDLMFLDPGLSLPNRDMPTIAAHLAYLTSSGLIILMGALARQRQERGARYLKALEESEDRFRRMADSAPVLIWLSDPQKRGVYFNRTWLQYTGRSLEDEIGDGWLDGVHPFDLPALDACSEAMAERRPFTTQFRLRGADGEYRWMLDSGTPRFDSGGVFLGFIGSCTDVHDRKLAEEARAWLAAIVSASTAAIVSKDLDGTILSWNAGAERLFGYEAADAIGRSIELIVPFELRDEERRILERLRRGERIEDFETTRVTKDQRRVDVLVTISPVRDETGRIVGASKVARDITEQRQALAALLHSEQRFSSFMSHLPGLAWIKDQEGRYLFANEAAQAAFGKNAEQLYGRTDEELFPQKTALAFRDNDRRALDDESGVQTIETLRHPDGKLRYSLVSKFPISTPDGPNLIGGVAFDVTERRAAEQALRESDRHKDAFLMMLGHELRNPLAPLGTGLSLLAETNASDKHRSVLEMMERQFAHLLRLVDDLLDLSRINRGKLQFKTDSVRVADVLNAAIEQTQSLITERRHELTLVELEEGLAVQGDNERLTQVFANLLDNAAKYMDQGGVIEVAAVAVGERVTITVRDAGCGIPEDRLATLFDFGQAAQDRLRSGSEGLGLGLMLSRRIVEFHGGSITAKSAGIDRGSEFIVTLPVSAPEARQAPAPAAPAADSAPRRILIVDDNVDAAESLKLLLQRKGHDVNAVYSGAEALREVEDFAPSLVLLDIGLPGMDGYEVAQRIRSLPRGPRIHLCAVTGFGQAKDKRRALEAGFDAHVTKPMDPTALAELIETCDPPVAVHDIDLTAQKPSA